MPGRKNQHFVPQFYFKLFTEGASFVQVLLRQSGRCIENASIKGQCAKHNLYGSDAIEATISRLETEIAKTYRHIVEKAWSTGLDTFTMDEYYWLLKGFLLQRSRTVLEADKHRSATELMTLEVFKSHLRSRPGQEELIAHIENGNVHIRQSLASAALLNIATALDYTSLLSDLYPCILLNYTDYPFIFGDSPAVLYNSYYRKITDRGVLGLQTPGLQLFLPLDSRTLFMMLDPVVYSTRFFGHFSFVLVERSDVSQLNALQLHHSSNALYFARIQSAEYVSDLWCTHNQRVTTPTVLFQTRRDLFIDGKPTQDAIYYSYEPQLPHELDLSFVSCKPIEPHQFHFHHRTPAIVEEHERHRSQRTRPSTEQ